MDRLREILWFRIVYWTTWSSAMIYMIYKIHEVVIEKFEPVMKALGV